MGEGLFHLPLFPDGPLQGSVIVTVFIGILVMTFFTETLGWVFSGLVVPGYLTPILIVAPYSAGVIVFEAILTYFIVEWLSEKLSQYGYWAPMFGRDKFICIVFISIVVRLVVELFGLPELGQWIQQYDPEFDYRNKFTGIGLVVVPLLANTIWKPGLHRGLGHALIAIAVTYTLVVWVLIPHTNFSVARFHFLYEAVALDFAASPKTYIILLMGIVLSAQLNLYLGWDFNGVMVPTLLALSWLTPMAFVSTMGEAVVILFLAKLVVMLPKLRTTTMEGPRLVCLLFTIGFLEKMLVGHLFSQVWPEFAYEHLFGHGYMLSTLLALKMWQKKIFMRLVLPVTQVSLAALIIGSLVGWGCLAWLNPAAWFRVEASSATTRPRLEIKKQAPYDALIQDLPRLLRPGGTSTVARMLPDEAQSFQALIERLSEQTSQRVTEEELRAAGDQARSLGFELLILEDPLSDARYAYLREPPAIQPSRGWGLFLFRIAPRHRMLIETPRPVAEPRTVESAAVLLELLGAHALIVPGAHYQTNLDGTSDVLRWSRAPFRLAHAQLHTHHVLEVRAAPELNATTLWVETELPEAVRVRELQGWLGALKLAMPPNPAPLANEGLRLGSRPSFCTLALAPLATRTLLAARFRAREQPGEAARERIATEDGHVVMLARKRLDELRGARALDLRPPDRSELLYFDQQVLTPLLDLAMTETAESEETSRHREESLKPVAHAARQIGYRLELVRHRAGPVFALLSEERAIPGGWGTFAIRFGPARPVHLLAPYPISELNTHAAALELFVALDARAVSLGAVAPVQLTETPLDARQRFELVSLYQLVHQTVQRFGWLKGRIVSLEVRGSANWPADVTESAILRESNILGGLKAISSEVRGLAEALTALGLPAKLHNGEANLIAFGLGENPQLRYSVSHGAGPYAAVWFTRETRLRFRDAEPDPGREALLEAVGLPRTEVLLGERLRAEPDATDAVLPAGDPWTLFGPALDEARTYAADRNAVRLERLVQVARERGLSISYLYERQRGLPMLELQAVFFPNRRVRAIVNLAALSDLEQTVDTGAEESAARTFLDRRPALLREGLPPRPPRRPEP
ncbi:MAG: hypothetical protein AMXMBFR7_39920 [Planctomycetota bacterium]